MNDAVIQFSAHTVNTEYCARLAGAAVHVHATVPIWLYFMNRIKATVEFVGFHLCRYNASYTDIHT